MFNKLNKQLFFEVQPYYFYHLTKLVSCPMFRVFHIKKFTHINIKEENGFSFFQYIHKGIMIIRLLLSI